MRKFLSEKNIAVVLFVMVLVTFALAQEDSKKMERLHNSGAGVTAQQISNPASPKF
jgi:hypothetical protein